MYNSGGYEDIINLPHHVSSKRPQMPMLDRAAQFSPFAALTGYDDAIHETGRLTDEKIDLSEEEKEALDRKQQILVELSDGSTFRKEIEFSGMVLDRDVHRPGAAYEKGDAVTHGGSYWIAKRDTSETPGKSDDWRLAVKRGRDGKDAE